MIGEMSFKCLMAGQYCRETYLETQSEVYRGPFLQK